MASQESSPSEESFSLTLIENNSAHSSLLPSKSINLDFLDQTIIKPATKPTVKKKVIVNLVERDGFIYMEEYESHEYVPKNEVDFKRINGKSDSNKVKNPKYRGPPGNCSFCGKRFGSKSTSNRHERESCKNHGAPNHFCDVNCPRFSTDDSNQEDQSKKKKRTR